MRQFINGVEIQSFTGFKASANKVFYSDTNGSVTELSLGVAGTVLQSNGASSAPTFEVAASDPLPVLFLLGGM